MIIRLRRSIQSWWNICFLNGFVTNHSNVIIILFRIVQYIYASRDFNQNNNICWHIYIQSSLLLGFIILGCIYVYIYTIYTSIRYIYIYMWQIYQRINRSIWDAAGSRKLHDYEGFFMKALLCLYRRLYLDHGGSLCLYLDHGRFLFYPSNT